jgi:lysophospholipase L1-like esterase
MSLADIQAMKALKLIQQASNLWNSVVNIFDKTAVVTSGYYDKNGVFTTSATYSSTNLMKVTPNNLYITNVSSLHGEIAFWDGNKQPITGIGLIANSWSSTIYVPNNSNIQYMTIPYNKSTENIGALMVVQGDQLPTNYLPFGAKNLQLKIQRDLQSIMNTLWYSSKNIFNKDDVVTGGYYDKNGVFASSPLYTSTGKMEVQPNTQYISNVTTLHGEVAFWDSNKQPITGIGLIANSWSSGVITIPNNPNVKYMTFPFSNSENLGNLMVVQGNTLPSSYTPFGVNSVTLKNSYKSVGKSMLIFGDSITETAIVSDDGSTYTEQSGWTNWITYSKATLQLGQVWNYAKSGATYKDRTLGGSVVTRQLISTQINSAIANNRPADIIVIAMGTNDGNTSLGDYTTAMSKTTLSSLDKTVLYEAIRWSFWTLRQQYPDAVCFVSTPLQRADIDQPQELIDAITKMANRYNFILIDAYNQSGIVRDFEVWNASGRFLADGLHPNTAGKQKLANLFSRVILNSMNY